MELAPAAPARHPPPPLFGLLVVPFGLAVGYAQVAVPFVLKARGLDVPTIATVSAVASWPHGWKFLWAPALDAGWRRRSFYFGSIALAAAALALTALIPPDTDARLGPISLLTLYTAALAVAQAGAATSAAAVDALMAITLPDSKKGAAAGWYNAGNLSGTGLGGAFALWLSQHLPPRANAVLLAGCCVACALPALAVHEPVEPSSERRALGQAFRALLRDVGAFLRSREGWTGLVICLSPVGTGAAYNLFSALAADYGAGEAQVELVNGLFGGLVSAAGCLFGGYLADRMNRRLSYVVAGLLTALVAVIMAAAPATSTAFTAGCLAYCFANGIAYAAFTAFVLEMIGHGPGVATKYALLVGASNQAISYVTWLDGRGYAAGRRVGLFAADAGATLVGVAVLAVMVLVLRRARPSTAPRPAI